MLGLGMVRSTAVGRRGRWDDQWARSWSHATTSKLAGPGGRALALPPEIDVGGIAAVPRLQQTGGGCGDRAGPSGINATVPGGQVPRTRASGVNLPRLIWPRYLGEPEAERSRRRWRSQRELQARWVRQRTIRKARHAQLRPRSGQAALPACLGAR